MANKATNFTTDITSIVDFLNEYITNIDEESNESYYYQLYMDSYPCYDVQLIENNNIYYIAFKLEDGLMHIKLIDGNHDWTIKKIYKTTLVTLWSNGNPVKYISVMYNTELSAVPVPKRNGFTFVGYFDEEGTKYYDEAGEGTKNWDKLDKNINLFARWSENNG